MYTGLLHSHQIAVTLFLVIYFIKMVLLLINKNKLLDQFRKRSKILEIVVSTLFLVTGIWMLILKPTLSYIQVIKLAAVVAAIPCGVIGFARYNKLLGVLSFVFIVAAYGLAEMGKKIIPKATLDPVIITDTEALDYDKLHHGKALYNAYCTSCHGEEGKLGIQGATDLTHSLMDKNEIIEIINNGKGVMPAFSKVLTPRETEAVATYVETLRENDGKDF